METIGYVLYTGLILSVLSFLFLLIGMASKKDDYAFDGADSERDEFDESEDEFDFDELEELEYESDEKPTKKSLFGFGKKRNPNLERLEEEFDEEDDEEDYEVVEPEDEYEKDFDYSFENRFEPQERKGVNELDNYEDEDIEAEEEIEIKRYSDEYFEEEEELTEQEKMLRRIEKYKNKM